MNDRELQQFEDRLRAIRPAAPRTELSSTLLALRPAAPRRPLRFILPLAAAAAVALCTTALFRKDTPVSDAPAVASATVQPVQVSDCIVGARDAGLVRGAYGRTYRAVQVVGVGQQVWRDEATGHLVAQTYPQNHLVLVGLKSF